jgi:hypothetical protein
VFIVDTVKRRLHREIVADPVLHGLVLNLYLNGERYPHRVDDYFPLAVAAQWGLAETMRAHLADEDKHVALYARAIEKLGQPVLELPVGDIFNEVIRSHTPASFAMRTDDDRDTQCLKLAHFLAHAHFLEKRIARSLEYHVEACAHSASPYPHKAVCAVLHDEHHHVRYTREAVTDLLPTRRAGEVLAVHARAERRANVDFSATQMRSLLRTHSRRFSRGGLIVFRACAGVLGRIVAHA